MLSQGYTKVFSGSFIIVQLVLDRLKSIGINAIVKDESGLGEFSGFKSTIQEFQELYVNNNEIDEAIPIIESVNAELNS